jgi:hypothetical protein
MWTISPASGGSGSLLAACRLPTLLGIYDWVDPPDRLEQGAATVRLDTPYFVPLALFRFMTCEDACLSMAPTRGTSYTTPATNNLSVTVSSGQSIVSKNFVEVLSVSRSPRRHPLVPIFHLFV